MTSATYDVVVVGAGANGLVAAAILAKAGKRVLVVERNEQIGGQAVTHEFAPGFRAAPLAIEGGWAPPVVMQALGLSSMPAVEPAYSFAVANDDGHVLALPRDGTRAREVLQKHSPRDAARFQDFVQRLRAHSAFLEQLYQRPAPDIDARRPADLLSLLSLGREFRAMGREGMIELLRVLPMPVQDLLDDEFENPALKALLAAGGIRDVKQGPRSGGTTFAWLHHLTGAPAGSVRARSWWREGPDAFHAAIATVAAGRGVVVRTGMGVSRILVRDEVVTGVLLDDAEEVFARAVISTADPATTMLGLIDPVWLDPEFLRAIGNIKFRGSTAFVHFALDRLPVLEGLDAGVSLTAHVDDLERAHDAAKYGRLAERPHIELVLLSSRWPAFAPAGKHVLAARVEFVPATPGEDAWRAGDAVRLGDVVTHAIGRVAKGFAETVLHREVMTPADIERRYSLTEGAPSQGALMLDQLLFMRPVPGWSDHAMPIEGLYLGGAGTHPGPGVNGGAGFLAARRLLRDRR